MGKANAEPLSVARRFANWASNLFVSGVVIVVALTFGRQTIQWWRAEDTGLNSRTAVEETLGRGALAPEEASHLLEFGDFPYVFNRIVVRGDAAAALSGLRRHCRQAALRATPSDELPSAAEERAIADLASKQPVAEEPGRWQMFENPRPLPMVLVVTPRKSVATDSSRPSPPPDNAVEVVAPERRVLSWGLAFPRKAEAANEPVQWTLFVWSPGERRSAAADALPFTPPPGSRRTMSLRSEEGSAIAGFRGPGQLVDWRTYVDDWARQHQWRTIQPWTEINGTWAGLFENQIKTTFNVQLSIHGEDQLQGLVTVTPFTVPAQKSVPQEKK